jgi:flagellar basal body-associated protein FliL
MKKPVVLGLVLMAVAGAGVGGMLFAKSGGASAATHGEPGAEAAAERTRRFQLEERTLNLADEDESHYLKIALVLQLAGPEPRKDAPDPMPLLMDALIDQAGRSTYVQLLTPEGKQDLKKRLAEAFGERLAPAQVRDVLFLDFVME